MSYLKCISNALRDGEMTSDAADAHRIEFDKQYQKAKNKGMNDLVEQSRRFLNEKPDEQEYELLNEFISLRTGAIAVGLGKVKQYANKTDQEVRNLKSYANKLSASKDQENANKQLADALEKIGNLFYLQRKMGMYIALTSAATGVGIDKSAKILKRMEKQRR